MRFSPIFGITFAFFLSSCGKEKESDIEKKVDSTIPSEKKVDTTNPSETIKFVDKFPYPCDANVSGHIIYLKGLGFQVCSEQSNWQALDLKGEAGPRGFDGPKGGSSLVAVYDAQDRKLGWLVQNPSVSDYSGDPIHYYVLLTSGATVLLTGSGYIIPSKVTSLGQCYYESNDCTGVCRAQFPSIVVYSGATFNGTFNGGKYIISAEMSSRINLGIFSFTSRKGGGNCVTGGGYITHSFAVTPLALASGASYPFEGPISLKAE